MGAISDNVLMLTGALKPRCEWSDTDQKWRLKIMTKIYILILSAFIIFVEQAHAQSFLETREEASSRRAAEYFTLQKQSSSPIYTPRQNLGGEWVNPSGNRVQIYSQSKSSGNRIPAYQPNKSIYNYAY